MVAVLLVEDDAAIRTALTRALRDFGHGVHDPAVGRSELLSDDRRHLDRVRPHQVTRFRGQDRPAYECRPETTMFTIRKLNVIEKKPARFTQAAARPFQPAVARACR
jgi:CheY-like chemotaxis protein